MKVRYNLHIHSCLSPCADDNMTPVTIVAWAHLNGLDVVAISDHNAIKHVPVAQKAGEAFDVVVVPAVEVTTSEDIHVLCLFATYDQLQAFWQNVHLMPIANKPSVFGHQLWVDEEDNLVQELPNLLLMNTDLSAQHVVSRAKQYQGLAIPAHVDRESNGMQAILGVIPTEFTIVEISETALDEVRDLYKGRKVIVNSDAHTLMAIGHGHGLEVTERSAKGVIDALKGEAL